MRITFIAVCLMFVTSASSAAPPPSEGSLPWTKTRALSSGALSLLEVAVARSAIVEGLLEDLERTDLIVYVLDAMPGAFAGPKSALTLVSGASDTRFLMIRIDSMRLPLQARIAALGHELFHALEVARAPEVRDSAGLAALYRRIGWETGAGRFESRGAQDTTFQIARQLGRGERGQRVARVEDGEVPRAVGGPSQN